MRLFGIMLTVLLSNTHMAWVNNKATESPQEVTFCQLANDPFSFIGKRVRVRAIYRYAFEVQRLEAPDCCPGTGIKIWVEIKAGLEGRSEKLFRKIDKGSGVAIVVFVGRFEGGRSYGTFGDPFQLTVDEIERVERTSRSSRRQEDPVWVPKCGASKTLLPNGYGNHGTDGTFSIVEHFARKSPLELKEEAEEENDYSG